MNNSEHKKRVAEMRGYIIQEVIQTEAIVDSIIIGHYTNNDKQKMKELHEDIVCKLPFSKKKDLLIGIIKKLDYQSTIVSQIKSDLTLMQELRNKVAHWNWSLITEEDIILNKTNHVQVSIDNTTRAEFKTAQIRVTDQLARILFKHYGPF